MARRLDIELDVRSRQPEIRAFDIIRSGAMVTGTLDGSHDAHNCRVIDVETPGNASQTFAVDASSTDNLAVSDGEY